MANLLEPVNASQILELTSSSSHHHQFPSMPPTPQPAYHIVSTFLLRIVPCIVCFSARQL